MIRSNNKSYHILYTFKHVSPGNLVKIQVQLRKLHTLNPLPYPHEEIQKKGDELQANFENSY